MSRKDPHREQRLRAIGAAIQSRRITLGMTQAELANELGVGQGEISRIESGKYSLGIDRWWRIAEVFGTTPKGLFEFVEDPEGDEE